MDTGPYGRQTVTHPSDARGAAPVNRPHEPHADPNRTIDQPASSDAGEPSTSQGGPTDPHRPPGSPEDTDRTSAHTPGRDEPSATGGYRPADTADSHR